MQWRQLWVHLEIATQIMWPKRKYYGHVKTCSICYGEMNRVCKNVFFKSVKSIWTNVYRSLKMSYKGDNISSSGLGGFQTIMFKLFLFYFPCKESELNNSTAHLLNKQLHCCNDPTTPFLVNLFEMGIIIYF